MALFKPLLRATRSFVYRVIYRGTGRWCPVCERPSRRFAPFGNPRRAQAMCPHCGALERHRLLALFFDKKTNLYTRPDLRMLHVAPEPCFEPHLRGRVGAGYLTADLEDPHADVRMDITHIEYPDATFDVIYCSHVLEHVSDDRAALRELHRVLKPDGWALIMVPITAERTFEDPSVTDPKERERRFGQDNHVRRYGRDFVGRLKDALFNVKVFGASDVANKTEARLMGLTSDSGEIFLCAKVVGL